MSRSYSVPARNAEAEVTVKKSRFIAWAAPAGDRNAALALVERAREAHPDARHHCWAYRLGDPESSTGAAMSDDGEPSGTAGKPLLNVIQHKGIGDVVVVVIRYFGGVKLGAGGLVRAYAGAAEAVLAELPLVRRRPTRRLRLTLDFADEQPVRHWAGQRSAAIEGVDYGEAVSMRLVLPEEAVPELESFCAARGIACHAES